MTNREGQRRPSRRDVVAGAAALVATGTAGSFAWARPRAAARLGTVVGAGVRGKGSEDANLLCLVDLDRPESEQRTVPLDFYGHGMAFDPLDAQRLAVFQKAGKGACIVDLGAGEVVQPIETAEGRDFYGHGAFSPDGAVLYATESVVDYDHRGVIVVRDGRTLEELGEFPSFGAAPHDCVLRDEGKTLVVTNGGSRDSRSNEPPCVTYVDVPTERLVERVRLDDPDIGAGHLALSEGGDLAVVSAARRGMPRDGVGALSLRPAGRELRIMDEPVDVTARMRGETLSVAIHEPSGIVGVTNPFGGLVTFWNMDEGTFIESLDLAFPRGIALSLDGSRFVVSYGLSTSLLELDAETLAPVRGSRRVGLDMHSSHIVVHDLA